MSQRFDERSKIKQTRTRFLQFNRFFCRQTSAGETLVRPQSRSADSAAQPIDLKRKAGLVVRSHEQFGTQVAAQPVNEAILLARRNYQRNRHECCPWVLTQLYDRVDRRRIE